MGRVHLHVGTYAKAGGAGLYSLRDDLVGGWALGEAFSAAPNASFGAYSARYGLHYLVDERSEGMVRVLRRDGSQWRPLARVPTRGAEPCYVALSPDEGWLAVANYGSGSVAVFRLDPKTGLPGDPTAVANSGHGPVADRQEGPHAHCALFSPDGKWLYQTDLGTDEVLAFAFDAERGLQGDPKVAFAAPAGSGPRHLAFHPQQSLAILVSELASTLTILELGEGTLSPRQTISTLPADFEGESLGGHLAISAAGDRVYVTNRGHDSIATLALDESGHLSLLGHTPSGGASPRFFLLLEAENMILVANEEGGNVTIFEMVDGMPLRCAEVEIPGPTFVLLDQVDHAN